MPNERSPSSSRVPELDGARGLACLTIVIYHYVVCQVASAPGTLLFRALRPLSLTWTGVDLFFVLSGFLLGGILLDHRGSTNLLAVFYVRRTCRIFPLYFAWLGLFLLIPFLMGRSAAFLWLFDDRLPTWSYAVYVQNFVMAYRNDFGPNWLGITWSLAVEEQFYLILPALILLTPARRLPWLLTALITIAPALRLVLRITYAGQFLAPHVLLPCRWDALFLGVLGAWAVRQPAWIANSSRIVRRLFVLLAILAVGVLALLVWWPSPIAPVMVEAGYTWMALFYLVVLLLTQYTNPISRLFRNRVLVFFGTVSYGIYLFHEAIAGLLHGFIFAAPPQIHGASELAITALAFTLTVFLAWGSYTMIESPMLRFARHWQYQTPADARGPLD
jgi:peptidoglycan/LPS O-acetylase OafA/YrhL